MSPPRNFLDSSPLVFSPLPLSCIGMGEQWCWTPAETLGETPKQIDQWGGFRHILSAWPFDTERDNFCGSFWFPIYDDWIQKRALFEIGVSESGDKTNKILNFMWFNVEWWSTFCFFSLELLSDKPKYGANLPSNYSMPKEKTVLFGILLDMY